MNDKDIIALLENYDLKIIVEAIGAYKIKSRIIEMMKAFKSGGLEHSTNKSNIADNLSGRSCSNCDNCEKDSESNMLYCEEHTNRLCDMFNPTYSTKYIGCNQWKLKK